MKPDASHNWFFLAGCQKTASTWLYHCFLEHPDIFVPDKDATGFFTIHYHKGWDWYQTWFDKYQGQAAVGDTTPSYYRFGPARERIAAFAPGAKHIITVRNPIDRAFSHYWHEKKKRTINWSFEDCVTNNVDIFESWIASGFYHHHLRELLRFFPREQLLVLVYDDLKTDAAGFCRQAFEFLGVDPTFRPATLDRKVNVAWYRPTWGEMWENVKHGRPARQSEYERGVAPAFREELRAIFAEEIAALSAFLGRDLSMWR